MHRIRVNPKAKSMTSVPVRAPRSPLFGPPLLLEGEDVAAYDELLARICAAVKPVDVIDEMFVADVVFLQWEILRLRRLKTTLIRATGNGELKRFLSNELDYDLYREDFVEILTETLQKNVAEDQGEDYPKLARRCAQNEPDAVEEVNELLIGTASDMDDILDTAKTKRQKSSRERTRRRNRARLSRSMSFSPRSARPCTTLWLRD
jgi:hypothetical protein